MEPATTTSTDGGIFSAGDDSGVSELLGASNGTFQSTSGFDHVTNPNYRTSDGDNGNRSSDFAAATNNSTSTIPVLLNTCQTAVKVTVPRRNEAGIASWSSPATGFVFESTVNVDAKC